MPVKEHPSFSLTLVRAQRRAGFTWQKGKGEQLVGAVFIAVNCQYGIKDQLDS